MHLRCPHCQNPIELADLPSGGEITCVGCGSSIQIANFSTVTWDGTKNKRLGKFEILGTVGHGAFGTVLKARDTELDRIVAIKVPRASNVGPGPDDVDRFLREARSVAQLRFPSIVPIHEVGIENGLPYLVCDFVEGITLSDHLTGRGFTFTESAKLLAEVADALQYAHSMGVVHRDVKPSNIMIARGEPSRVSGRVESQDPSAATRPLTALGSPMLLDFGLAKRDAGEITMTIDGQILGTPAYMSPEQARGDAHKVDGRSDVYSLGVILYQLLTGELPFRGNKAMLLHQVLHEEPKSPRTLNDKIPRDLETIALKAMAKEPGRRYGSAKEMADDLRRWLAGEPILARPVGKLERLWRWCKRKPALATANAAVLVALITFVVAFFIVSGSLEQEQIERGKAVQLAKEKEKLADDEQAMRIKTEKLAEANRRLAGEADERREQAETLALRIQFEHYFSKAEDRPDLALVGIASLLPKAIRLKDQSVTDLLRLQVGAWSGRAARLNALCTHQDLVIAVTLSADGKTALTGSKDKTARLWDTATGKPIGPPLQHQDEVRAVVLSADGKIALTGSDDKTARLWDTATGKPIGPPLHHEDRVEDVAMSADGKTVLTGSADKTARLWDTATGKPIGLPLRHQDTVVAVALSADGKTALTGSWDKTARLWETATSKPIGPSLQHQNYVYAVALSTDGKVALTGSLDKTARIWETATGNPIGSPLQHQGEVSSVALSADGKTALTGSWDKTARLWDTATGKPIGPPLQHQGGVGGLALSADGKTALTGSWDKSARLWEVGTARSSGPSLKQVANAAITMNANGTITLTGNWDKTARLWEAATGRPIGSPLQHREDVIAVALSADGRTALTASKDQTVRLWETATSKPIGIPLQHPGKVVAVAMSGNGKLVLTAGNDKTAQLWDAATGRPIGPALQHQGWIKAVALTSNGKMALTGCERKGARLWDTATGNPIEPPLPHQDYVVAVALSADGKTALTGGYDMTAQLWETATSKPIGPPLQHPHVVRAVTLSADGKTALTGCDDKTARLWDTANGKTIGPPLQHEDVVRAVALSADGKSALTASAGVARLWKVPQPIRGDPERIELWTQVITGLEVDELTNVRVLDAAAWHERRARLEKLGGPPVE